MDCLAWSTKKPHVEIAKSECFSSDCDFYCSHAVFSCSQPYSVALVENLWASVNRFALQAIQMAGEDLYLPPISHI